MNTQLLSADRLFIFAVIPVHITYDNSGNPANWRNGWDFGWTRGRMLSRATRPGVSVGMSYDVDGIRTNMSVDRNGVINEHEFFTHGGQVVAERRIDGRTGAVTTLEFIYDESGRPLQLIHNGILYNYTTNLQGDVVHIRDAMTGERVAWYVYNAWGHVVESGGRLAEINPIRYRGYFWCTTMELYYLQSRWYDGFVGRFINADSFVSTGQGLLGFNMFAYCGNNPVNRIDSDGHSWQPLYMLRPFWQEHGDILYALSHSITIDIEFGLGIGIKGSIPGVEAELVGALREIITISPHGVSSRDVGGVEGGILFGDVIGVMGSFQGPANTPLVQMPSLGEAFLGIIWPGGNWGLNMGEGVRDTVVSFGASVYKIIGGGASLNVNISQFRRRRNAWNGAVFASQWSAIVGGCINC